MRRLLFVASFAFPCAGGPFPVRAADTPRPAYEQILKVDVHSHVFEDIPALADFFHQVNLRTVNVCVPGTESHFAQMHRIALALYHQHPDLYPFTATFDPRGGDQPDYAARTIAWLDEQFAHGAVGVKFWKEVGMEIKDRDGKFILPDDPMYDPIYAHLAKIGKPLHAHLAEPIDAWRPLDPDSPHYNYYKQNPHWHLYGKPGFPSHEAIIAARDNIMKKHPTLVLVGAHLGSMEHDLDAIAAHFERYPNFYIDVAARTRNLARHPSDKVRALFQKYPTRILYGVDAVWMPYLRPQPPAEAQRRNHLAMLETRYKADFDYYAGEGPMTYNGRPTEALHLPTVVLEKFYHENAERIYQLPVAWQGKP